MTYPSLLAIFHCSVYCSSWRFVHLIHPVCLPSSLKMMDMYLDPKPNRHGLCTGSTTYCCMTLAELLNPVNLNMHICKIGTVMSYIELLQKLNKNVLKVL